MSKNRLVVSICLVLAMLIGVVQAPVAGAMAQHEPDSNDSRGAIDLELLSFNYANGHFTIGLKAYDNWASNALKGRGSFISVRLSRQQASEPRRLLTIDYKNGHLVARIDDTSKGAPAPTIARPTPKRPHADTVRVRFSKKNWGRLGKRIFWEVSVDERCAGCTDVAPDDGTYYRYNY